MSLKKHRMALALGALGVVTGAAVFATRANKASHELGELGVQLPKLDKAQVDHVKWSGPGLTPLEFRKTDGGWRMVQPLASAVDAEAIEAVLDQLAGLEAASVVSSNPALHERLEVVEGKAVHVQAGSGGQSSLDLWLGPAKSTGTLVRVEGGDAVVAARGAIRPPFVRAPYLYRNRAITDFKPSQARKLVMSKGELSLSFERDSETDAWRISEGAPEVRKFDGTRVTSLLTSLGRLRATNFDEPDTPLETPPDGSLSHVTIVLAPAQEGGEPQTLKLSLGALDTERHEHGLRLEGSDALYRVSDQIGKYLVAEEVKFIKKPVHVPPPLANNGKGPPR